MAPTLFLWGEADPFGGAEVARSFVEPFADARLGLVPGAGHAIWMDNPSLAADAVTAFLGVTGPRPLTPDPVGSQEPTVHARDVQQARPGRTPAARRTSR